MIRLVRWLAIGGLAVLLGLLGGTATVWAEDTAADNSAAGPSAEQIQLWIKDLDSEKFATREHANQRLLAAGGAAVEAVTAAVDSKSREVAMRAMQILEQLYRTGKAPAKDKCRAALEKIASADSPMAAKAAEILKPPAEIPQNVLVPQNGLPIFIAPGGGIPLGNVQIMGGMQAGNVRIRMQNVNGHRTVDATEGDRKVHIEEDPQAGIDMKVTEKVEGKETTTQYKAKNLDELKKNHPVAEGIYRKYAGGNNVPGMIQVRMQVQNMAIPGFVPPNAPFQPLPGQPVPVAQVPAVQAPAAPAQPLTKAAEIAANRKLLADLKQQLAKTAQANPDANLQKAIEQLQAADDRLAEAEASAAK